MVWDYLRRSYELRREAEKTSLADVPAVLQPDPAERKALSRLEGAIERALPVVSVSDLGEVIAQEKRRLLSFKS